MENIIELSVPLICDVNAGRAGMKPNNKPYILGLTGGIASGKSNVAAILGVLGPVIDADEISRNITAKMVLPCHI